MKALITTTLICLLFVFTANSQPPWRVSGNSLAQLGGLAPELGTELGNNLPLQIITNGTQDLNPYAVFQKHV